VKSKHSILTASTTKVAAVFLTSGVLSIVFSLFSESQILAFIGLGLTFWGALFIVITPRKYVEGSLLDATAKSSYLTVDRIIKDLKYKGKGYYIPPYPKDVYLPEHLKGLKDLIVFISAANEDQAPSIQEMAESKFLLRKPKGALVTPPGLGLLTQIENKMNADFTKMTLEELCEVMPRFILDNLNIAREMELTLKDQTISMKLTDSIYKNLYSSENDLKSITLLGCPIVSAVACAIAKTSGKTVIIQKQDITPDASTIQVTYEIIQG
jgi:hypothetical protein